MAYTARALRAARFAAGLSIEQVAERSGISVDRLTIIDNGTVLPSVAALDKLAGIYGVEPESLYEKGNPTDPVVAFAAEISALVDLIPPLSAGKQARLRVLLRGVA